MGNELSKESAERTGRHQERTTSRDNTPAGRHQGAQLHAKRITCDYEAGV